jgi:hypothetical protein
VIVDSVLSIRQGLQAPYEDAKLGMAHGSTSVPPIDESGESPPSEPINGGTPVMSEPAQVA